MFSLNQKKTHTHTHAHTHAQVAPHRRAQMSGVRSLLPFAFVATIPWPLMWACREMNVAWTGRRWVFVYFFNQGRRLATQQVRERFRIRMLNVGGGGCRGRRGRVTKVRWFHRLLGYRWVNVWSGSRLNVCSSAVNSDRIKPCETRLFMVSSSATNQLCE